MNRRGGRAEIAAEVVLVRRVMLFSFLFLILLSGLALAQCDCTPNPIVGGPDCYVSFYAGNPIEFKLVVPGDYFMDCFHCPVPGIVGWRVETAEGAVVYEESFIEPKGHYYVMTWCQKDTWGNPVPTGFYRLVIVTDSAGEVVHYVNVQERPCTAWPCWCGGCWGCCPEILESVPCCVPCGVLYLQILNKPSLQAHVSIHLLIVQTGSSTP
jgi:hypothetical protein